MQAKYSLTYVENVDGELTSYTRFFTSLENAQAFMKKDFDFQNSITPFPSSKPAASRYNDATHPYTSISANKIRVRNGMNSRDWYILPIVPEDAGTENK